MGDASDDVKRRAKRTAREAADRARHVAEATAAATLDEAERQGLTPAQLAEKAEHAAAKASEAAKESMSGASVHSVAERVERVAERAAETAKREANRESQEMTNREIAPEDRPPDSIGGVGSGSLRLGVDHGSRTGLASCFEWYYQSERWCATDFAPGAVGA